MRGGVVVSRLIVCPVGRFVFECVWFCGILGNT